MSLIVTSNAYTYQSLAVNSLAPERFERNLRKVIFKLILMIGGWGNFCKIALRWMSMDLTDNKSTLVQVMAWCRQTTNHYLSQCWPRFMSPYVITRPQWVDSIIKIKESITKLCVYFQERSPDDVMTWKCFPQLTGSLLTHWGQDKLTPFRRRHFQRHFLEWKCYNFD